MTLFNSHINHKMLRLIKTGRNSTNDLQRLWFSDTRHDLFVWLLKDNTPVSFQFSYDKLDNEHSLNWDSQTGYSHEKIDNGELSPASYKMTPIMIPDGEINSKEIAQLFQAISQEIHPELAKFIVNQINNSAGGASN